MRVFHTTCMAAAISVAVVGTAVAQTNLEKLGAMQTTGVTEITYIDQSGANAAAIRHCPGRAPHGD